MRRTVLWISVLLCVAACGDQAPGPDPAPVISFQSTATNAIDHGRRLSDVLGCTGCHGADLTGEDWSEPGFGRLWTANLTVSAADLTDAELDQVIRSGRRADRDLWGMPSHLFTHLSADDMAAVIAFIRSQPVAGVRHPGPTFEAGARQEIASGLWMSSATQVAREGGAWPPDAGPTHALGRYIARATCAECHGIALQGGQPLPGRPAPPDLRVVGAYDADAFRRLMRTGLPPGDRDLGLMAEVARGRYSRFTDSELDAVYAYLKQVADDRP